MTGIGGFLDRNLTMTSVVTRVRAGDTRDDMNRPEMVETSVASSMFAWPVSAEEITDGLEVSTGTYRAVFPASLDIAATDRVEIAELGVFEVEGPPERFTPIRGSTPALQTVKLVQQ